MLDVAVGSGFVIDGAEAAARADPAPRQDVALAIVELTAERSRQIIDELDAEEHEALHQARTLPNPVPW
jgi:hypothetical protein